MRLPGTLPHLMKSSVAPLEGNKVKLSVEVDEAEFDRDIDAAFRVIAKEVRLPGFRPGKAPRRILEARIGLAPAREQALRDGIPQYLAKAVREHDVDIIATPEVDITAGQDDGPVAFDATVEGSRSASRRSSRCAPRWTWPATAACGSSSRTPRCPTTPSSR